MRREIVENLARQIPAHALYYRRLFGTLPGQEPPSEWERVDRALADLSFGANVPRSYAAEAQPLPDLEWPVAMRRAYEAWSHPEHVDDNLVLAESFNLPENGDYRAVMRALQVCEDGTDELIGNCFQCDPEVAMLFGELFFNVRDRRSEPFFLANLLQGERPAGQSLQERCQGLFGRDLLKRAIRTRSAQDVLAAAQLLRRPAEPLPAALVVEQIVSELMALAASEQAKDVLSLQQSPALALVLKYKLLPKIEKIADSALGFELNSAELQPLYDDLDVRLAQERAGT